MAERLGFRYVDEDLGLAGGASGGVDPSEIADEERRKSWPARVLDDLAVGGGEAWAMTGFGSYGAVEVATTLTNCVRTFARRSRRPPDTGRR